MRRWRSGRAFPSSELNSVLERECPPSSELQECPPASVFSDLPQRCAATCAREPRVYKIGSKGRGWQWEAVHGRVGPSKGCSIEVPYTIYLYLGISTLSPLDTLWMVCGLPSGTKLLVSRYAQPHNHRAGLLCVYTSDVLCPATRLGKHLSLGSQGCMVNVVLQNSSVLLQARKPTKTSRHQPAIACNSFLIWSSKGFGQKDPAYLPWLEGS